MTSNIVIYKSGQGEILLEVNLKDETIWLNQAQISELFQTERSVITKHLKNIFNTGELDEKRNVQKMHIPLSDKPVKIYNLDVIISVGYRVNSRIATQFRIWATKIIKDHIIKGYSLNQKRLNELKAGQLQEFEQTVALIKKTIETRRLSTDEASGLLNVITDYAYSWILLQRYDEGSLEIENKNKTTFLLDYEEAMSAIEVLKGELTRKKEAGELFGLQRDNGLKGIIGNINQTFDGNELYPSIEDKAAHLLYFIIKDHPFVDGNKRISSFLFIIFLMQNKFLLRKNGDKKISDNALVALALLLAESNPENKDLMIKLIMNFLGE